MFVQSFQKLSLYLFLMVVPIGNYFFTATEEAFPKRPKLMVMPALAPSTWRVPAVPRICMVSSQTWAPESHTLLEAHARLAADGRVSANLGDVNDSIWIDRAGG